MSKIIGIDIGGTNFRIGFADGSGNVSDFRKLPVKSILRSDDVLSDIAGFIEGYAGAREFDAVAAGFPATLNRERTKILQAPNLGYMENLPVVEYLQARLNVPVFAERDVTFALYYDMRKYNLPPEGITCGIYFGTGIGNAIMIDGVPLLGCNGVAGELGHIPVWGSDEMCGCGLRGCIENLAGGKYLARIWRELWPESEIAGIFAEHGNDSAVREFVSYMAVCAATEINILDPDYVIIGGGVANMKGFPRESLHSEIKARTRKPYPAENLRVIYADDEPEKCVAGAGYYACNRMARNLC
ncbi:MAG: allose kinase [Synergistaceae bacterium]|nr:allose kinase [Synergistaceae bacterium]